MSALAVTGIGLVTPVGLSARSSAAALRAGIMRFSELPFHDRGGVPIVGARVREVADGLLGVRRYAALLGAALADAERRLSEPFPRPVPLVLGLPAQDRPGRPARLEAEIAPLLETYGGWEFDPATSAVVSSGNTSGARALEVAQQILRSSAAGVVVVACADSLVNAAALDHLEASGRLKTATDPDGVIPSEAAGALVVARAGDRGSLLEVAGIGFAKETADRSRGRPNVGEGLARAIRSCLADAGSDTRVTHFRLSDVAGDRGAFSEAQYALGRTLTEPHAAYPLWLTAESFGEIGAASVPAQIAVAAAAFAKDYAPGPGALCQSGSESGERAALLVRAG